MLWPNSKQAHIYSDTIAHGRKTRGLILLLSSVTGVCGNYLEAASQVRSQRCSMMFACVDDVFPAGGSGFLPESVLCTILKHCLQGLVVLHDAENPLVHLDIKPHNILFKVLKVGEGGAQELEFKLSDLGSVARADAAPRSIEEGDVR